MAEFDTLVESFRGVAPGYQNRMHNPAYLKKLAEANNLMHAVGTGDVSGICPGHSVKYAEAMLYEAMSTSDFPILLGDNVYSRLLAAYEEVPSSYQMWCNIDRNVPNFHNRKLVYWQTSNLLNQIKEGQSAPQAQIPSEGKYEYAVGKYEESMSITFEMLTNDSMNAINSFPQSMAQDVKDSIEHFATSLICDANGPDATFFSSANKNKITAPLSVEGLRTAIKTMRAQKGPGNKPIMNRPSVLAVSPALEETAKDILGASNLMYHNLATGSSKQNGFVIENNNRFGGLQLAVLEWLPYVVSGSDTAAEKSWFLFADPSRGRGAVELGFLRGYGEQPLMLKKSISAQMIGGGDAPTGSFENDSFDYKVVSFFGGCLKDPKFAVGSDGSS